MSFSEVIARFNVASYIFLGLFVIASIFELIFAFKENEKWRRIFKPFCLFFLGLLSVVTLPNYPLIYIGSFMGMIGDIFLLIKKRKMFLIGATTFFIGHLFYIAQVIVYICKGYLETGYIIALITIFVIFFVGFLLTSKKLTESRFQRFGIAAYYSLLLAFLALMVISYIKVSSYMYLGIIGISLFIISDVIILIVEYIQKFKRHSFYIMLTYLLAQFFVVSALLLSTIATV